MGAPGTARWGDWLRRYFGTKGTETVNVLQDVMPVVNLLEEAPELRAYRNERRWVTFASVGAGGAGTYAQLLFGVPATSNRLVVIERVMGSHAAAGQILAAMTNPSALTTQLAANYLDSRASPNTVLASNNTDLWYTASVPGALVAASTRIDHWTVTGVSQPTWAPFFPGVVLVPGGTALIIQDVGANIGLDAWVLGYDVPIHGSEVT